VLAIARELLAAQIIPIPSTPAGFSRLSIDKITRQHSTQHTVRLDIILLCDCLHTRLEYHVKGVSWKLPSIDITVIFMSSVQTVTEERNKGKQTRTTRVGGRGGTHCGNIGQHRNETTTMLHGQCGD
jgi:hypothetical protein